MKLSYLIMVLAVSLSVGCTRKGPSDQYFESLVKRSTGKSMDVSVSVRKTEKDESGRPVYTFYTDYKLTANEGCYLQPSSGKEIPYCEPVDERNKILASRLSNIDSEKMDRSRCGYNPFCLGVEITAEEKAKMKEKAKANFEEENKALKLLSKGDSVKVEGLTVTASCETGCKEDSNWRFFNMK